MTDAAEGMSLRISSDALPARERAAAMREWVGRKLLRVELEPVTDRPFRLDLMVRAWPGLALAADAGDGRRQR